MGLTNEEKMSKVKIEIQYRNPFFAYLSLFIKFKEDTNNRLDNNAIMGVNAKGIVLYKKEFVEKFSVDELIAIVIHEILHLAFLHLIRRNTRQAVRWNISTDLAVNVILNKNGFKLPEGVGILPNRDDEFVVGDKKIEDISSKTAEEIYDLLPEFAIDKLQELIDSILSDEHMPSEDENGNSIEKTEAESQELDELWRKRLEEAVVFARQKGNMPSGMDRIFDELHNSKLNWKVLLRRYLMSYIPKDYTWNKPNKRSVSVGVYLPDTLKEKIDICVGIDVSGSIGKKELTDFMSEIVAIAREFRETIGMRVFIHDVFVSGDYQVENGNIEKLKKIEIKGGGGTSHQIVMDTIKDKVRNCRVAVFLTDGESDINRIEMSNYRYNKIFVLCKDGNDYQIDKNKSQVIRLEN